MKEKLTPEKIREGHIMSSSSDILLSKWLSNNASVTVTQEALLGGRDNEVIIGDQGDVNSSNNRKSRIEEVQDEIEIDNSSETEIIIDDNQAAEVEQQPDAFSTSATDELLKKINACKAMSDLTALKESCQTLPGSQKEFVRPVYANKQKQLKDSLAKPAKKDPESCFKCSNQDDLASCTGCGHDYCATHWGIADDRCEVCVVLDDLAARMIK